MVRQPVMVDGTALQWEGVTDATVTLWPRKVSSSFYVVRGLKYGILGTDVLASLEIQIDVTRKRLYLDGKEVTEFDRMKHTSVPSVCLIKFGRVYSASKLVASPGEERIIRGKVQSNTPGPVTWTGIVEVLDEFTERSSLLGMCYCS